MIKLDFKIRFCKIIILPNFEIPGRLSCRSQKMLKDAYLLAKIGADTAEKEQNCVEILTEFCDVTAPAANRDLSFCGCGSSAAAARPQTAARTAASVVKFRLLVCRSVLSLSLIFSAEVVGQPDNPRRRFTYLSCRNSRSKFQKSFLRSRQVFEKHQMTILYRFS